MRPQNLHEKKLGELGACNLRSRLGTVSFLEQVIEQPLKYWRLRFGRLNMDPWGERVQQEWTADGIKQDMTADVSEVTPIPQLRYGSTSPGKDVHGVHGLDVRSTRQD